VATGDSWVGVYWQTPPNNWGQGSVKLGRDLSAAKVLSFRAKAAEHKQYVEFGIGGIRGPSGDSMPKLSQTVKVDTQWKRYSLSLKGVDLSHIVGGFLVVMTTKGTIFLDDISFDMKRPRNTIRLIPSFRVTYPSKLHPATYCAAHLYDNALAMIAFAAIARRSDVPNELRVEARARLGILAEAVLTLMKHDRAYADGRLRNVYWGGGDLLDRDGNPLRASRVSKSDAIPKPQR